MMAQTLPDFSVSAEWEDVTKSLPALSGVRSFYQNKGLEPVFVWFSPDDAEPAGTCMGEMLQTGERAEGTAAHIFLSCRSVSRVAVGICD